MKIVELNIIQFGKLQNERINFSDGFNIIEGKNESGKSTVSAFIKFIFYGMSGKSNIEERKRGLNWNSGVSAGTMTLIFEGNVYRIERMGREDARGSYSEKVQIIDVKNGNEVFEDLVPGEVFCGVPSDTYDSLCNVRQLDCTGIDTSAVRTSIDNILTTGDEKLNVDKAIETLDKERVKLLHKNNKGGEIFDLDEEIEKLESEFSVAVENEDKLRTISDEIDRNEKMLEKLKKENDNLEIMIELSSEIDKLDKFKKLHKIEDEISEIKNKLNELKSMIPSGVEPTFDDVADMKNVKEGIFAQKAKIAEAEEEFKRASEEKKELESVGANEKTADILSEYGDAENFLGFIKDRISKSKFNIKVGIAFFILTALLSGAGGAILALGINGIVGAGAFATSSLCLVLGLIFTVKSFGIKKDVNSILSSLGGFSVDKLDEVHDALTRYQDTKDRYENAMDKCEKAEIILGNEKEKLSDNFRKANELLSKFGITADIDSVHEKLGEISGTLKKYISGRDELQSNLRELFAVSESLKDELQVYSERAIKEKFTEELEKAVRTKSLEELKNEREVIKNKLAEVQKYKSEKEKEEASLSGSFRGREEVWEIMKDKKRQFEVKKRRYEAITLAEETLKKASDNFKNEIMPRIKTLAGESMSLMTDGKYGELGYNSDMELTIYADNNTRKVESLSKGTVDLCYFAMRLSLIYNMCQKEKPVLILDETLSQIDDERAKRVFSSVGEYIKNGGQAILFTCQKRDITLAKSVLNTNIILL